MQFATMPAVDHGLYGPGSITWRATRETVMLLGGPRALLMQLAHPLVAAGVADHSSFRDDPIKRLRRTLDATLAIVFGSTAEATAAGDTINRIHGHVRGTLRESVGRFPAGTPYDARDPELLLWVQATLVDTTLEVYPRYVAPLSLSQLERVYEESKTAARMLMVPEDVLPKDLEAFRAYMRDMIASDAIAVGAFQRELADAVLHPPIRYLPRRLAGIGTAITAGLLPEKLRHEYGLELTPARRRIFEASARVARGVRPALPRVARVLPQARAAYRRIGR